MKAKAPRKLMIAAKLALGETFAIDAPRYPELSSQYSSDRRGLSREGSMRCPRCQHETLRSSAPVRVRVPLHARAFLVKEPSADGADHFR